MNRWLLTSLLAFGLCTPSRHLLSEDQSTTRLTEDENITIVTLGRIRGLEGPLGVTAANGRMWQHLDKQSKIYFLSGIGDGVTLLLKQISDQDYFGDAWTRAVAVSPRVTGGFRWSEVAKQVDLFYSDSANVRIPIIEACRYSVLKMKGEKNSDLEQTVVRLRQTYNQ
jgi:hypothetical protein